MMRKISITIDSCMAIGFESEDCPFYRQSEDDSWCFLEPKSHPEAGKYPPEKWLQVRDMPPEWCDLRHGSATVELVE